MLAVPLVRRGDVSAAERDALAQGTLVADLSGYVRYELTGKGRASVLQGIVSCDVEKPKAPCLFGALLTAKGMIVTPLWITILDERIIVEAPASAGAALGETFVRTMPPRLCTARDITSESISMLVFGNHAPHVQGSPAVARGTGGTYRVVRREEASAAVSAGMVRASDALLETCRIEAGIPRLGSEIDDRTLPQEVGLERLGAISFTKGCYIGQETVARLHWRGHANRRLVSVDLDGAPGALPLELEADGKPAGRLTSAAWSDAAAGHVGLAMVRREVADGDELRLAVPDGAAVGPVSGAAAAATSAVVRGERWLRPA